MGSSRGLPGHRQNPYTRYCVHNLHYCSWYPYNSGGSIRKMRIIRIDYTTFWWDRLPGGGNFKIFSAFSGYCGGHVGLLWGCRLLYRQFPAADFSSCLLSGSCKALFSACFPDHLQYIQIYRFCYYCLIMILYICPFIYVCPFCLVCWQAIIFCPLCCLYGCIRSFAAAGVYFFLLLYSILLQPSASFLLFVCDFLFWVLTYPSYIC